MRTPATLFALAALAFGVWVVLTFVIALRSGWTHVALVGGVLLVVAGIAETTDRALARRARRDATG